MKRILPACALALLLNCGPSETSDVLLEKIVDVPAWKIFAHKFELPLGGTFTFTVLPKGSEIEAWVQPRSFDQTSVDPEAEKEEPGVSVPAGAEKSFTGTLAWGQSTAVLLNRTASPAKVKVKLTVVPTKPS